MGTIWLPLIAESDFPAEGKAAAQLAGWHVLVARTDAGLFAVNDRCTHQAARISAGRVRRGAIMCPLHGARFELDGGRCAGGTYPALRTFALRVEDGIIEVAVPDEPPGMVDLPMTG